MIRGTLQRSLAASPFLVLGSMILLFAAKVCADSFEIPPPPAHYVYDGVDWLSPTQESSLADSLSAFERSTSNQLVVAIFRSLQGEEIQDLTHRVAEAWGMGRKDRDNGVLLAIYAEDRKVRIEVGYGLEGVVTDATAFSIIQNEILPRFRAGDRVGGIRAGVSALMAASRGEYVGSGRSLGDRGRDKDGKGLPVGCGSFSSSFSSGSLAVEEAAGAAGWEDRSSSSAAAVAAAASAVEALGGGGGFIGGGGGFGGGGASGGW